MHTWNATQPLTAALFDLDGTLVDSLADIRSALNGVLEEERAAPLTQDEVRGMVGDGSVVLMQRAFAARSLQLPDGAHDRFRARYVAGCLDATTAFDGMADLLRELSASIPVAVVTNKPAQFSAKVVTGVGLGPFVRAIICPEQAAARKPSPDHVQAALQALGVPAEGAVMVGDSEHDILAGAAAGVRTIAVTWGCRPRATLVATRPDALVDSVAELRALLLSSLKATP